MVYTSRVLHAERPSPYDAGKLAQLYLFFRPSRDVDYYVVDRHGLASLSALVDALASDRDPGRVPNLGMAGADGEVRFTETRAEAPSLQDERIDWDGLPDELLRPTVAVRGSIGCPFSCTFCNFNFFAPKMQSKPLAELMREIDQLARRPGVERISLADDSMLLSRGQVRRFCQALIDRDHDLRWTSFVRADSLAGPNLELVARSGSHLINIGVESGDPAVLANMDKKLDPEATLEVISELGGRGVSTSSTLLVGFPGKTEASVSRTIDLLNRYRSADAATHWYYPFVFMVLPKIPVEAERARFGLDGFMLDWRHDTMDAAEAARQLKRMILSTEGAVFPWSSEHPLAAEILGIDAVEADRLVRLAAHHVQNQIRHADDPEPSLQEDNARILREIEKILTRTRCRTPAC